MAYLTPTQRTVLRTMSRKGAGKKSELLAGLMTSIVESGGGNPNYGDRDSVGWRQERSHYGSVSNRLNVRASAGRFADEIKGTRGTKTTPGQKAQAVQRSAFPGRYDAVRGEAEKLLRQWKGGGGARFDDITAVGGRPGAPDGKVTVGTKAPYMKGAREEFDKTAFIMDSLGRGIKGRLKNRITSDFLKELSDPGSKYKTSYPAVTKPGKTKDIKIPGVKGSKGYLDPGKGKLRGGAAELKGKNKGIIEVFHDPVGEYLDNGTIVKGAIGGHGSHVHVSAQPRTALELGRLAQSRGLSVRENPFFDPVDPVHTGGSYHYKSKYIKRKGGGRSRRKVGFAIDVSGGTPQARAQFARDVMNMAL